MLPNDAAVLVELAFLKRRQFMRVDARRLLESVVEQVLRRVWIRESQLMRTSSWLAS